MPKIFVSFLDQAPGPNPGPKFARYLKKSLARRRGIECVVEEHTTTGQARRASLGACSAMLALVTEAYARSVFDRDSLVHKEVRTNKKPFLFLLGLEDFFRILRMYCLTWHGKDIAG